MQVDTSTPSQPLLLLRDADAAWEGADPETFQGTARVKRLGGAAAGPEIKLFCVAFEPGARTHWHVHSGPQLLVVVEGRCLVQCWDGPVEIARSGDVVHIAPGVKHWHGAGPDEGASHIAVNVAAKTTWMEPAPDA